MDETGGDVGGIEGEPEQKGEMIVGPKGEALGPLSKDPLPL